MTESKSTNWQNQVYLLYLVSLSAWAAALLILIIKLLVGGSIPDTGLTGAPSAIVFMLLALPGLAYFFWQSRKMRRAEPETAKHIFNRMMVLQHITGIVAMAGGVLGLLPFLANFLGMFGMMTPNDIWNNVGLMLPWVSLYGFITTYSFALGISRSIKKASNG